MQDFLPSFLRPPPPRRTHHRAFAPVKARPTTVSPSAELPGKHQPQSTTLPPSSELPGKKYPRPSSPPTEALHSHNLKLKSDVTKKLMKKREFDSYKKSGFPPFKKVTHAPTSTSASTTTTEITTTTISLLATTLTTLNKTLPQLSSEGGEASHALPSYADPPPLYSRPSSPPPDFLPRMDLDSQNGDDWSPLEGRMDSKPLAPPLTFYEVPGPSATRITKSSPSSSYGAPKSKPSSSYYGPPKAAAPSYGSPKAAPLPSYGPPKAVPSYSPPKPAVPSYSPPKSAAPSYSPPKPASPKASLPSYGPPAVAGPTYGGGGGRMPYAFDYVVASSYGATFAAREEESGRGTVGQFQLVCSL